MTEKQCSELKSSHAADLLMLDQTHEEAVTGLQACVEEKQVRIDHLERQMAEFEQEIKNTETNLAAKIADLTVVCESMEKACEDKERMKDEEVNLFIY